MWVWMCHQGRTSETPGDSIWDGTWMQWTFSSWLPQENLRLARCSRKCFRCQVALALLCGLFCPVLMKQQKRLLQNLACSAWSWGGLRPSNVQEGIVNDQWSVGIMFLTAVSVPRGRRVGLCLAQPAATASWIALVVLGEWGRRKWRHDLQGQFARSLQDLPKFCKFFS